MRIEERAYEKITVEDLTRLRELALRDLKEFFKHHPRYEPYENSLILMALCQGAALHFIDGKEGVKDFDVWSFFAEVPSIKLPYRRRKQIDSGLEKFGVNPDDFRKGYKSRHIDLFMRTIEAHVVKDKRRDPRGCITEYLRAVKTKTARSLAEKAVVGLYPDRILGEILYHRG